MKTTNLEIGTDLAVIGYSVQQKGYGRQALYVDLLDNNGKTFNKVYVNDVFPNVIEHYQDRFALIDSVYQVDETEDVFADEQGREYEACNVFCTVLEMLNVALEGNEIEVEVEQKYVIAWDCNGIGSLRFHHQYEEKGCIDIRDAVHFDSEEEAQELIYKNEWVKCFVKTVDLQVD